MSAVDIDDMVIELSRLERLATARMMERRMIEQKGEAFEGLPLCDRFILPTVPYRESK